MSIDTFTEEIADLYVSNLKEFQSLTKFQTQISKLSEYLGKQDELLMVASGRNYKVVKNLTDKNPMLVLVNPEVDAENNPITRYYHFLNTIDTPFISLYSDLTERFETKTSDLQKFLDLKSDAQDLRDYITTGWGVLVE